MSLESHLVSAHSFATLAMPRIRPRSRFRSKSFVIAAAAATMLSGCASFSADQGMGVVNAVARKDIGIAAHAIRNGDDAAAARASTHRLLHRPLTVESAVAIALLNNKGLQAAYNELGIEEARRIRDSLPPNPSISFTAIGGAAEVEVERKIAADILALATLPLRTEIATERFRQAQLQAALETLRVAAEARRAYYRAVGAEELIGVLKRAKDAAQSTATVALELGKTGAINKLDQAREQAFYAETTADLAAARQAAVGERERLVRALGLWGSDLRFHLPDKLPALPKRPRALPAIEVAAVRNRVDLQIARMELEAQAKSFGLTQATRFINVLQVGGDFKTTKDKETGKIVRDRGIEASFEVPIFDFGEARSREARETYLRAVNLLMQQAVNVRSEAREAYAQYRSAYELARHYQTEVLPLQKIISDESQLRFSSMLIDVFALLAQARERIAAERAAVTAKQDFWLADASLHTATNGGSAFDMTSSSGPTGGSRAPAASSDGVASGTGTGQTGAQP